MTYSLDSVNGCWEWGGYRDEKGYGQKRHRGRVDKAHRWAYETFVAPIPAGLEIDHLCRNRGCVNPAHLEPVTHQENLRRATSLITHCPAGHPYDEANTCHGADGRRSCRACMREATRRRRAAVRSAVGNPPEP